MSVGVTDKPAACPDERAELLAIVKAVEERLAPHGFRVTTLGFRLAPWVMIQAEIPEAGSVEAKADGVVAGLRRAFANCDARARAGAKKTKAKTKSARAA